MMMELIGCLPPQHQVVLLVLLAKPTGGFRTIGLMPMAQRVWARMRRDQATAWEANWQREYFWAGKAKGAEDAAWMTAFEDEAAWAQGRACVSLLLDLIKCFEKVPLWRLAQEGIAVGFPKALLRMALATYATARRLTKEGAVSQATHTLRGIIAGCGLATTCLRVVLV